MTPERVLVNFFYAHRVGHAVEALHSCLGHHSADPRRLVSLALNASTAHELAAFCPFIHAVYPIDHPFVEPCTDSAARLVGPPQTWDWVLDDFRRRQDFQLQAFPRDARLLRSERSAPGRSARTVSRRREPAGLRATVSAAIRTTCGGPCGRHAPAEHDEPRQGQRAVDHPHARGIKRTRALPVDRLVAANPGRALRATPRSALRTDRQARPQWPNAHHPAPRGAAHAALHPSAPVDCFDIELAEQLAIVEASSLFLSPHTGFGLAALAVGTPWLTISGGPWFEYYFNHVPFRSILPDVERYPAFSQWTPAAITDDGQDGPRTPSMTQDRIRDDLNAIVSAATELINGTLTYDQALADYFRGLLGAHDGNANAIWSIDGVHLDHLPATAR
jgi:hypothetical protein